MSKHTTSEKASAGQPNSAIERKFDDAESQILYDTSRLRLAMEELSAWKLAAQQCGLYRADSDVNTAEKWASAQSSAACALLAERDSLLAENDALREALERLRDEINGRQDTLDKQMEQSDRPEVAAKRNADQLVTRYEWSAQAIGNRVLLGIIFAALARKDSK